MSERLSHHVAVERITEQIVTDANAVPSSKNEENDLNIYNAKYALHWINNQLSVDLGFHYTLTNQSKDAGGVFNNAEYKEKMTQLFGQFTIKL